MAAGQRVAPGADLSVVRGAEDPLARLHAHIRNTPHRVLLLAESAGRDAAVDLGIAETDLYSQYERPSQLAQALIDEVVQAIILDSYTAEYFVATFPEQLQIAGGEGRDAWLSRRAYGIAVAADNTELLDTLNGAQKQHW